MIAIDALRSVMRAKLAAKLFITLMTTVVAFQLALAAGAPWGEFTMGGRYRGRLPPSMRLAAFGAAVLLAAFAVVVAARASLALRSWQRTSRWLVWVVVAFSIVSVVLNTMTTSVRERAVWLPVTLVLTACALTVARGPTNSTAPR
jgi:hypothetical protein